MRETKYLTIINQSRKESRKAFTRAVNPIRAYRTRSSCVYSILSPFHGDKMIECVIMEFIHQFVSSLY